MTDLERAKELYILASCMPRYEVLAAWEEALAAARLEGAEEMRERAAQDIDCGVTEYCKTMFLRGDKCSLSVCPHEMAEGIRALPLTTEPP